MFKDYNMNQVVLPLDLERKLKENDIAFTVHQMVEQIPDDAFNGFLRETGCPAYHPRMMMKIILCAYTQSVFSGRKIEALLEDSVRMMWLAQGYEPSYRTINRFRVHPEVKTLLRQCFVQFRCQLVEAQLIDDEAIFIVQIFVTKYDASQLVDRNTITSIQGFSLDILITSAIATVSIAVIGDYLVPFLLLAGFGIAWNIFGFFVFGPRMMPDYWLERAVGDFGQSTGVTATGLMLIRVADPEMKSPATEGFGYKQLVFEPFLGGGVVTALSAPLVFMWGPWPFLLLATAMTALGLIVGLFYFGRRRLGS